MNRRQFLGAIPGAMLLAPRSARGAAGDVSVFLSEPVGTISPYQQGHFVEHLGGVVYDGVWVGEGSKIANIRGVRKALVDAMKPLGKTVVRWPGGCFADSYDWKDGVGPMAQRPRKPNFWMDAGRLRKVEMTHASRNDPNHFGTNEFMRFCRLVECEPYFAANVRSLTAKDFYDWIDYCNAPAGSSTLADKRAAGGDKDPYKVRFWGVGNESWGCGGNMTAGEYSVEYRKFTAWVPRYGDQLSFIPSGPNGFDVKWTREFFQRMAEKGRGALRGVWGWAVHYYCGTTGKSSTDFTSDDAYQLLANANRMDQLIRLNWNIMAETDPEHRVKIAVDEWGAWHPDANALAPHHLFGSPQTMRDALVAGLTLDTFQRHADKVAMANVAQLVNCIQTLFLADGDQFCVTPTYHVFAMYKDHQNAQAVRAEFNAPLVEYTSADKPAKLVRLAGSASVMDKTLTVTAVNTSLTEALPAVVQLHGGTAKEARGEVLAAEDIHVHNNFKNRDAVKPGSLKVEATDGGGAVRVTLPPMSVVKLQAMLA
ncbi:MAG: alpha-L-arabinofuranosidase C-terminal domain-containing protein [Bryobacteraceae bacterium]|nr:alpha-L-arabinofuranosidase C-terminal domain-containing protein [Bryobacteraceae bacterium]